MVSTFLNKYLVTPRDIYIHKIWGKCKILGRTKRIVRIKQIKNGEHVSVLLKVFKRGIKKQLKVGNIKLNRQEDEDGTATWQDKIVIKKIKGKGVTFKLVLRKQDYKRVPGAFPGDECGYV